MIVKAMGSACLFLEIRWQKGRQADQPFVPNPALYKPTQSSKLWH